MSTVSCDPPFAARYTPPGGYEAYRPLTVIEGTGAVIVGLLGECNSHYCNGIVVEDCGNIFRGELLVV